jgi:hypothetical protein
VTKNHKNQKSKYKKYKKRRQSSKGFPDVLPIYWMAVANYHIYQMRSFSLDPNKWGAI